MGFSAALWFLILILSPGAIASSEANSSELSQELILKPLAPELLVSEAPVPEVAVPEVAVPGALSQEQVIPKSLTSQTSGFFVLANLEFTLLHELSHMLIELL